MPPPTPRTTRSGSVTARSLLGSGLGGHETLIDLTERDRQRLLADLGLHEGADVVEQALLELAVVRVDLAGPLGRVDDQGVLAVGGLEQVVDRRVGDADRVGHGSGHAVFSSVRDMRSARLPVGSVRRRANAIASMIRVLRS